MDLTDINPQRDPTFNFAGRTTISGGSFRVADGDMYNFDFRQIQNNNHTVAPDNELGLLLLSQHISHGAIHDSAERYPAGKCHPGTREAIIKEILEWINDPDPSSDILWVFGSAGAGKSAIMQTIAELLRNGPIGRYAGSFFFAQDVTGRNDGKHLFATLAYQIATNLPGMRLPVNDAMKLDQTLPTKSMDIQLKSLITNPLVHSSYFLHQPTIIIDGLDECRDTHTQRDILTLISDAIINSRVPLRFLIASRPESWINDSFNKAPLFDLTKRVSVDNWDADKDIEKYLQHGFAEIYAAHSEVMSGIELPWPSKRIIDYLVDRASGQFIYASTVLKFVGSSEFVNPDRQLSIVSTSGPMQGQAFSELDLLFTRVLSVYPEQDIMLSVLGGILSDATLKTIEIFMDIDPVDIKMVLRALASLIETLPCSIKAYDKDLQKLYGLPGTRHSVRHLSFREFIEDKQRSGVFSVDIQAVKDSICDKLFRTLAQIFQGTKPLYYKVTILECTEMWNNFTWYMFKDISPTKMYHHIDRFLLLTSEFRADHWCIHQIRPDDLLRPLTRIKQMIRRLKDPIDTWGKDPFDIGQDTLDRLDEQITAIEDALIREILCKYPLASHPIIPYIIHLDKGLSMDDLCNLPHGNEVARIFLLENAQFMEVDGSDEFLKYRLIQCFTDFLTCPSRGGTFHFEFRKHHIQTTLDLIKRFCCIEGTTRIRFSWDRGDATYQVFKLFFDSDRYCDFHSLEDLHTAENVVNILYNCRWVDVDQDENSTYSCIASILHWLSRYMVHSVPNLQKLLDIIVRMYHNIFVPMFSQEFFGEFLVRTKWNQHLLSLSLDPLSCSGEIFKEEDVLHFIADIYANCVEDHYFLLTKLTSAMTSVLVQLKHNIPIPLSAWFTCVTELHLHILLRGQCDQLREKAYSIEDEGDYNLWLQHVQPTEKILFALRAILHLNCVMTDLLWGAPLGFGMFATDLLKKFNLDPQESRVFARILKDLISSESRDEYGVFLVHLL